MSEIRLSELEIGAFAKVIKLSGEDEFKIRMNSLGIHSGCSLRLINIAPFSGPLLIEESKSGGKLMISMKLAGNILVRRV